MAETFNQLVDRLLRDHEGYTGDGQGGEGALPIGDQHTAARTIAKSDLRRLIKATDGAGRIEEAEGYAQQVDADLREWVTGSPVPGVLSDYIGRVVVIGSSTLAGMGTTGYFEPSEANGWTEGPNSCVALLRAAVGNRATIINRSVSGASMVNMRQNFWERVAPYRPRFVIIGTGFVNEAGATGAEKAARYNYSLNAIVMMCRAIGATPIGWTMNPVNEMSEGDRMAMRSIKRAFAMLEVPLWDMSGATAADNLNFLPGLASDSRHGNDEAHRRYFQAVNLGDFRAGGRTYQVRPWRRYRLRVNSGNSLPPLNLMTDATEDAPYSASIFIDVFKPAVPAAGTQRILSMLFGDTIVRLHQDNSTGNYTLTRSDGTVLIASGVNARTAGADRLLLCYRAETGRFELYINGSAVGTSDNIDPDLRLTSVSFGGASGSADFPALGYQLADFRVWRKHMIFADRQALFAGDHLAESLMVDVDMQVNARGAAINTCGNTSFRLQIGPGADWVAV